MAHIAPREGDTFHPPPRYCACRNRCCGVINHSARPAPVIVPEIARSGPARHFRSGLLPSSSQGRRRGAEGDHALD